MEEREAEGHVIQPRRHSRGHLRNERDECVHVRVHVLLGRCVRRVSENVTSHRVI